MCCLIPTELLFPQTPEELDDSDFETEDFDNRSRTSIQTEDDQLIAGQSARVREEIPALARCDPPSGNGATRFEKPGGILWGWW